MRWAGVAALWGGMLAAIAVVGLAVFGFPDSEEPILFGGAVATMVVLAVVLTRRGEADLAFLRSQPDVSLPVPWLGVAVALLALSLEVGYWLTLIATGMIAVGAAGLVRELRAERAELRRAREEPR
jgi:hypothetical protein